ncbi:hypothetical protein [Natrinema salinisoli]|uniref:hypothetical protein n=1 Tax=Natrinema salinisoli TaxID=2878535 RepID=UPI001CF00006|nr:hypothetical protein [Natrinema salinisoli]
MPIINQDMGGGYKLVVLLHSHELDTNRAFCVPSHIRKRSDISHYNIKIYKDGDEVFNLHGGAYREHDDLCLFMFETELPFKFCEEECFDTDPDVGEISAFVSDSIDDLADAAQDYEATHSGAAAVAAGAAAAAILYIGPANIAAVIAAAWVVPVMPPPP